MTMVDGCTMHSPDSMKFLQPGAFASPECP